MCDREGGNPVIFPSSSVMSANSTSPPPQHCMTAQSDGTGQSWSPNTQACECGHSFRQELQISLGRESLSTKEEIRGDSEDKWEGGGESNKMHKDEEKD